MTHHGVAYINLSSLLYPGVTKVFGAYCIDSLNEAELSEKTNDVHNKNIMETIYKGMYMYVHVHICTCMYMYIYVHVHVQCVYIIKLLHDCDCIVQVLVRSTLRGQVLQ